MSELLGRPDLVAGPAQASDVAVVVAAAEGEGLDVVGHGGSGHAALVFAIPAERFGVQAPAALLYACAATEALGHNSPVNYA